MLAEGYTLYGVARTLNSEGVPPPRGKRWYTVSMTRMVWNDAYKGTWYYGRERVELTGGRTRGGKRRRKHTAKPKDEWIGVPVLDSGIPHEIIDRARENLTKNYRPRQNARHYYELKGLVFCEECGLRMTTYTAGGYRYYICQKRRKYNPDEPDYCHGALRSAETTAKRKRSLGLENGVMEYVQDLISNPDKLRAQLDVAKANEATRNPDKDVASWGRIVEDCDKKRAKYQEMYAADLMTMDELSGNLRELDETRSKAEAHLAEARAGQSRVEELRATKRAMLEAYGRGIYHDGIRYFNPEMRGEIYDALQLVVTVAADGSARIRGNADANVIRLTRGVADYAAEVEEFRGRLRVSSLSKDSDEVMAEVAG
jgi:hypothetical protein